LFATVQSQMIAWTSALVVGLGTLTVHSMLQPPVAVEKAKTAISPPSSFASAKASSPDGKEVADRSPASQSPDALAYAAIPLDEKNTAQAVELTLPCPTQTANSSGQSAPNMSKTFAAAVKQIRLSGQACGPKRNIASVEILNEANGFSATVFHTDDKSYTTDYISLAPGQNRIRILETSKDGHHEETAFLVNRQ
jgi:hypothetical protein